MENKVNEKLPQTYLLHLNDYCMMDILKLLEYRELVNLSNTCTRLRSLCVRVCFKKYNEIEIQARVQMPLNNQVSSKRISQQDFKEFSMMVGKNHLQIKQVTPETDINDDVELLFSCTPLQLPYRASPVRHYRKLKLPDIIISANDLKKCFISNPDMQCEYEGNYDPQMLELLVNLPKLKKIKIYFPAMHFKVFMSIVEKLEFVEEIDLGRTRIYWYDGNTVSLGTIFDPLLFSQIVSAINKRKLSIFTSCTTEPCRIFERIYRSNNLIIINRNE